MTRHLVTAAAVLLLLTTLAGLALVAKWGHDVALLGGG